MPLDVNLRNVGPDVVVVTLSGRLQSGDALTEVERIVKEIAARGHSKIVLECSSVEAIDSAGVGMLLLSAAAVHKHGGHLRLVALSPRVAEVLRIARVLAIFDIDDDLEVAIRRLSDPDDGWFEESTPSDR